MNPLPIDQRGAAVLPPAKLIPEERNQLMSRPIDLPDAAQPISRRRILHLASTGALLLPAPLRALGRLLAAPPKLTLTFQLGAGCRSVLVDLPNMQRQRGRELPWATDATKYYLAELLPPQPPYPEYAGVAYDVDASRVVVLLIGVKDKCGARVTLGAADSYQGGIGFDDGGGCNGLSTNAAALGALRTALWAEAAHAATHAPVDVVVQLAR